jgi:hypothetical protein
MNELEHRMQRNCAIVALANKLARIAWAVLVKGANYHWPGTDQLEPREALDVPYGAGHSDSR